MLNKSTRNTTQRQTSGTRRKILASIALLLLNYNRRLLLISTTLIRTLTIPSRRGSRRGRIISALGLRRRHTARTIIVALSLVGRFPLRAAGAIFDPEGAAHVWLPLLVPAGRQRGRGTWWRASHWGWGAVGGAVVGGSVVVWWALVVGTWRGAWGWAVVGVASVVGHFDVM